MDARRGRSPTSSSGVSERLVRRCKPAGRAPPTRCRLDPRCIDCTESLESPVSKRGAFDREVAASRASHATARRRRWPPTGCPGCRTSADSRRPPTSDVVPDRLRPSCRKPDDDVARPDRGRRHLRRAPTRARPTRVETLFVASRCSKTPQRVPSQSCAACGSRIGRGPGPRASSTGVAPCCQRLVCQRVEHAIRNRPHHAAAVFDERR